MTIGDENFDSGEIEKMAVEVDEASPRATDLLAKPLTSVSVAGREDSSVIAHEGDTAKPESRGSRPMRANISRKPQVASARIKASAPGKTRGKKTLGSVLRARRTELRLTQREVAAKLGVKPAHIAYLELDHRRPSLTLLSRIAEVLDLEHERLILLSHPEARSFMSALKKPEVAPRKDQGWRDFKRNKTVLSRYHVSKKELRVLSQVALLGRIETPRNFLFILNSIRQAVEDEEL
jgi:transcriptional regulator with XRE-family HTH domain